MGGSNPRPFPAPSLTSPGYGLVPSCLNCMKKNRIYFKVWCVRRANNISTKAIIIKNKNNNIY